GNILLSRKKADDELSWDKLKKMMEEKTVVEGKITEVVKAGAILYVEGIRGFIPASKLALEYVDNTEAYLNRIVRVQVIGGEEDTKRLVLSAKELLQEQAIEEKNKRISRLVPGNIVEGTVETLKDYGAFLDIGDGISGLLHISQIQETRVKNIRSVLKEGQKLRVVITKVDNGKVSLSRKALIEQINTERAEEEPSEYSDKGEASTSLADLLKGLKL
ncbi:MAG: S1 RNA-binding domain-containing protein, partial [Lachnospiraceae bacterium]|nr:S1 RNA-binding domain-containing protein [Lachnospiraceae bacterium]